MNELMKSCEIEELGYEIEVWGRGAAGAAPSERQTGRQAEHPAGWQGGQGNIQGL